MKQKKVSENGSLAVFIEHNLERIVAQWEHFARSILVAGDLDPTTLRDDAIGMLREIASDLRDGQTPFEQSEKSKGRAPQGECETPAEKHGAERFGLGFSVNDAISEFRALRASVLRLWAEDNAAVPFNASLELTRFNEAIDQALAESLERFALEKDKYTHRFDTLLSSSPDLQYILGIDGHLIYANQALGNLIATITAEGKGISLAKFGRSHFPRFQSDLRAVIDTREPLRAEVTLPLPNGTDVTYRYVLVPVLNREGAVDSVTGTARNISELKASEERTYRNAYYDSLTKLPNRVVFVYRLDQNVRHAERTGKSLALMFIDLDGFKEVNDRSGHAIGDQLLQETARRIASCVRGSDTVARNGGDEFTVILNEIQDKSNVEILAQTILAELARPFEIGDSKYFISGSMGITLCPQDGGTPDDLQRNADQAMYIAKKSGRNRFIFFTAAMRDSAWARIKTIDELRHALRLNQLEVHYQPIVDLRSGAIDKAEALLRWNHPHGELMLPDAFIGLAEQTGLIVDIGSWVLAEAVKQAREWSALLGRPFQISVNKSPVEFMNLDSMNDGACDVAILAKARHMIAVEITEGILLNDSAAIRQWLAMLKDAGVQFTIDDFGIGYSSMSYLKKFKVDFLKIDQLFVKDMMHSADGGIFAETIIIMAHKLGLKVVAEGVETVEQRDRLKTMKCDYAQGFLYSKAVPPASFAKMLESRPP